MTYNTLGELVDIATNENSNVKWTDYVLRLLKLNGKPASNISMEEVYLAFLYFGKLGEDMNNTTLDKIIDKVVIVAKIIQPFSAKVFNDIIQSLNKMNGYLKGAAAKSLANSNNKNWW